MSEDMNENYKSLYKLVTNIHSKIKTLIVETPEYDNCYYKDECGHNCTPKREHKVDICLYEELEKILNQIESMKIK